MIELNRFFFIVNQSGKVVETCDFHQIFVVISKYFDLFELHHRHLEFSNLSYLLNR